MYVYGCVDESTGCYSIHSELYRTGGEGGMIASPSSRVELSDVQIVVADDSLIFLIHLLSFFIFTSLSPILP